MIAYETKTVLVGDNFVSDELAESIASVSSGIVFLRGSNAFLDLLASETTYEDRQGVFNNNGMAITVHLCPVYYTLKRGSDTDLIHCRQFAVSNLYYRWCKFSERKNNAEYWFNSKSFIKFLKAIEYHKTDYIVFKVD